MADWIVHLPLWGMIRSFGVVSYLFLTIGICLGILYSFPGWNGRQKVNLYKTHTCFTNGGTLLGMLHGVITVIDTYMPFKWSEVLIPFAAANHPVLNGLGTIAGYGMLMLIFTSDFRHVLKKKIWRMIHMISYPVFLTAFVHGYFLGTDSAVLGIRWMYLLSIVSVAFLTFARFMVKSEKQSHAGDIRRAS